ncbi:copper-transporting ATPase PAA1, chloroplastic-like, partial [Hibiscus syriacus]|uniref:copper-transporting ATPase PAA1, chloroplastic-like n=1 Tax=Hibiscus syriacus TaxID=106335 RepID=UPI0019250C93
FCPFIRCHYSQCWGDDLRRVYFKCEENTGKSTPSLSASVDLASETAIVWPVSEAKALPNWQKELGEALAKHLTTCGFNSNLRGEEAVEGVSP